MKETEYQFAPSERPLLPGSPYSPAHPTWRRVAYAVIAVQAAITAILGNALISTNVANIAGSYGEYVAAISLLPGIFVAMNATGNLTIVKARIQFGIPAATQGALALYAFAALLQLLFPNYAFALVTRAAAGLSAAALITISVYYLFQVVPQSFRPQALIVGIGLSQLATPIARLFPVEMLAQDHWRNMHLIELALPLAMLTSMQILPLPPSDRSKAFEPLDFMTIALVVTAMLLISAVLSEGKTYWWTDTPWLGWTLAAAVPLIAIAYTIERHRRKPLVYVNWIGSATILELAAGALLVRTALSEQTYGSVGLLASSGLNNEQMRLLFLCVTGAMLLGIFTAVVTLNPRRLREQVLVAALAIAAGAWIDSHATSQTRPHELFLSQCLIGFGATMFIGPTLAFGFLRMLERGSAYFITLVVVFSTTQNLGSLVGNALLGTYQVIATRAHSTALAEHLVGADPQVIARVQSGAQLLAGTVTEPGQQAALGSVLLAQSQAREAAVLAFNDVFRFVAELAIGVALFLIFRITRDLWRAKHSALHEVKT